jgi:hypothetical protein
MPSRVREAGSGVAVGVPKVAVKELVEPKLLNIKFPAEVPYVWLLPVLPFAFPDRGPMEVFRQPEAFGV